MSTLNDIFKKIEDKTELASHEVHLATVKEVDDKLKSFGLPFAEINKVQSPISNLQGVLRVLEKSINDTITEAKNIENKAKELGLDAGISNSIKYAQGKLKEVSNANSLFARFGSEIEKLK